MLRLRRPSADEIDAALAAKNSFNYPEVGASARLGDSDARERLSSRYDVDRHEFTLGRGLALFERATSSLLAWRQFEIPWLTFHGAGPVAQGQGVATLVCFAGLWFLNPCRVVYTELRPEAHSIAYAYGTLRGHPERGEERFEVCFDPATEDVLYRIAAFSRPALMLSKLGYPLARRLQKRFAASSMQALRSASA